MPASHAPIGTGSPLRSLLVHVDSAPASAQRLALAAALARSEHAALHAVFAEPASATDLPYAHVAGGNGVFAVQEAALARRAHAREWFDELAGAGHAGLAGLHWTELNGEQPARQLAWLAQCNDLVLLGQAEPGHDAGGAPIEFVESVLLGSGRPALLVPARHHGPLLLDTAVVAWKPSAECARALAGALPLLRQARRVLVVSWAEEPLPSGGHVDIAAYLLQHGVAAEVQRHRQPPRDVGAALAQLCRHEKAGLLVMGCYSHTRLRERVLGGATRSLLHAMPVPLLMAH